MKIKPKEAMLNLPIVLYFDNENEIHAFASNINTVIHGKVKMKYDVLGMLAEKYVSIFYLQRNDEYHSLREDFRVMIENDEMDQTWLNAPFTKEEQALVDKADDFYFTEAMYCEHANEVPMGCVCKTNCYCKNNTCKRR